MGVRRAPAVETGRRQPPRRRIAVLTLASTSQGSPDRGDIAISYLVLCAAGTMESVVGFGNNAGPGDAGHGDWCGASGRSRARHGAVRSAVTRTHRASVIFYPRAREEQCLPADPARSALARSL